MNRAFLIILVPAALVAAAYFAAGLRPAMTRVVPLVVIAAVVVWLVSRRRSAAPRA
jgi:hypothetical protein